MRPTATYPLIYYSTPTTSPIPAYETPQLAATLTPFPSPTPFTYTIVTGDTLLAIAYRFGVSTEDILKVNPGIDPGFLTIGSELVIPIGESGSAFLPTPTPVPLIYGAPQCYRSADQSLWCYLPVLNENHQGLEGIQGEINIYDGSGELINSQAAQAPLNVIPPGQALPLLATFPGPVPEGVFALGFVHGAFLANNTAGRYFENRLEIDETTIAAGHAVVDGEVVRSGAGEEPSDDVSVSVVIVAFGPRRETVGLRKWEWQGNLPAGQSIPFEIEIYSHGPEIESVVGFAEIRPLYPIEEEILPGG
jgi:LysM repeat protein